MSIGGVKWRLHLRSSPERVFAAWATDAGRVSFWAESSRLSGGAFTLSFPGEPHAVECAIVDSDAPGRFAFTYFDGTRVEIELARDGAEGTDLTLRETGFATAAQREANLAGWVSVLMNL